LSDDLPLPGADVSTWLALPAHLAEVVWVLVAATVLYTAFHYGGAWSVWLNRVGGVDAEAKQARAVHVQRGAGVLLLGVVPALVALGLGGGFEAWGLGLREPLIALGIWAGLLAIAMPAVLLSSRKPASWQHYPLIRAKVWSPRLVRHNVLGWVLYLTAYEFFFRGFLLFALTRAFGLWPGVLITTLAYVFAHLPKFAGETLGTIPMGVLFSLAALYTGGIWVPLAVHIVVAISSDFAVLRANPELSRTARGGPRTG
jgi:membrane protease YdiL (CAAX protease family)